MNETRVLIVANDPLARAGLAALLTAQESCRVVGQVAADSDLTTATGVYQPQVLLWDLGWEAGSALEHLTDQHEALPPVLCLVRDEQNSADAWAAGAKGLMRRDADLALLLAGVDATARGLVTLDPSLALSVMPSRERPTTVAPTVAPSDPLTPREQEVLQLLAEGLPNKIIAQRLTISEHTVKFHINAILGKLGAQSRTDAVVRATRSGLLLL